LTLDSPHDAGNHIKRGVGRGPAGGYLKRVKVQNFYLVVTGRGNVKLVAFLLHAVGGVAYCNGLGFVKGLTFQTRRSGFLLASAQQHSGKDNHEFHFNPPADNNTKSIFVAGCF